MKYVICVGYCTTLAYEVNDYLRQGWELYGMPIASGGLVYQAMVKPEHSGDRQSDQCRSDRESEDKR